MKSLNLNYVLFFLFVFNSLHAQSNVTKWRSGFTLCGGANAMFSKPIVNDNNVTFIGGTAVSLNTKRTWKFHYQAGLATGFFTRWSLGDSYALQGELNLLLNRQEAELSDVPPVINDPRNIFFSVIGRKGTVHFSTLYLQIPLIISKLINEETAVEGGVFVTRSIVNNTHSQLTVTTFSGVDNTGRVTVFTPPKVAELTTEHQPSATLGWLLGIQHNINNKIAMRLRYQGGTGSNFRDFTDLREQQLLVGMAFRLDKK